MAQRISSVIQTQVNANAREMLKVEPVIIVNYITTVFTLDKDAHHVTVIQLVLSTSHVMMLLANVTASLGLRMLAQTNVRNVDKITSILQKKDASKLQD